jgi:hypothetical protein
MACLNIVYSTGSLLKKLRESAKIQGYSKRSIHFQKFILQKLLTLNPYPVYGWKGNLSKF